MKAENIKGIPDSFVDNVAKYRFYSEQYKRRPNLWTEQMVKKFSLLIDQQLDEIAIANAINSNDIEGRNFITIQTFNIININQNEHNV